MLNLLLTMILLNPALGDQLAHVDLVKLLDPATQRVTVKILAGIDDKSGKEFPDYRLVACPQMPRAETLHALLVKMEQSSFTFNCGDTSADRWIGMGLQCDLRLSDESSCSDL